MYNKLPLFVSELSDRKTQESCVKVPPVRVVQTQITAVH